MTKIRILYLKLRNFKGASDLPNACVQGKNLDIPFGDHTTISGDNASLKTTCFDAFTWLLFDKNSDDDKDFSIKTLKPDHTPIPRLEHEVEGKLDIDGRHVTLRKVYKEKYTQKKGETTAEWTGHTTEYFCDDVPLSQKEYKARVDFLLKEDIAKLITNPLYFNQLPWKERRSVLEAIAGEITNDQILDAVVTVANKGDFIALINVLNQGKTTDDYRKEIGAKKKKIREYKDTIPTRVEELKRVMPKVLDYAAIEVELNTKLAEIAAIEQQMEENGNNHKAAHEANKAAYAEITKKEQELNGLRILLGKAQVANKSVKENQLSEFDRVVKVVEGKVSTRNLDITNKRNEITMNLRTIESNGNKVKHLEDATARVRDQWKVENSKEITIDEHKFTCPTCQQLLPEAERTTKRETLTKNFNTAKAELLNQLHQQGISNNETIVKIGNENEAFLARNTYLEGEIALITAEITALTNEKQAHLEQRNVVESAPVEVSPEVVELQKQIEVFVIPTAPQEVVVDNSELKINRANIALAIDGLRAQLSTREQIQKLRARITELEGEEATQGQQLADLEKIEFTIDAFSKAKVETIENRINGKFKYVRFKMFDHQINGGEAECCETMLNGVPYPDINTAGKIICGIDIINALVEHYGISAPIWIDNRESTIRIPRCISQVINLKAVEGKPLTITASIAEEEFVQ